MADAERQMPHSDEAERSMLGSILIDNNVIDEVRATVSAEDIYRTSFRYIYQAMLDIHTRGDSIDVVSLVEQLRAMGVLQEVGGRNEVARLANAVPSALNADTYASIIRRNASQRKLIATSDEIIQSCLTGIADYTTFIDDVERKIFDITQQGIRHSYTPIREVITETFQHIETLYHRKDDITGVPSGFVDLDAITSGWQRSDLIILAARPGMGKTSLTLNMLAHAALKEKIPAAFFSLEMSNTQLAIRLLCSEAKVSQSKVRRGNLQGPEWERLVQAVGTLSRAKIFMDDTASLPIMSFRSRARRLKAEHDIGIIFVDYLQLMRGSNRSSMGSREQEISEISRNLKAVAKELDIPIIALAQLNRGVESRTDKRPLMSDLRESGAIEQDADLIMFIYRDEVYNPATEQKNIAELIIGKHRNGALATVELRFTGEHTRFDNFERQEHAVPVGTFQ